MRLPDAGTYKPQRRYTCTALAASYGAATCLHVDGASLEVVVVDAFFQDLAPAELETSYCNGVPVFRPVFSGLQTGSCSLSPACQISLSILGEMLLRRSDFSFHEDYCCVLRSAPMDPCGTPL